METKDEIVKAKTEIIQTEDLSEVARVQDNGLQPVMTLEQGIQRYDFIKSCMGKVLKNGIDWGVIDGCGDKPALLKPGAEKLATLFGLSKKFILVEKIADWTGKDHIDENGVPEPFFYYRYKCELWRGPLLIADSEGSCNSWESKYRYRWKNGERIKNPDVYGIVNTIEKMGEKRALVAAVLVGVGASDFFTQDEDALPGLTQNRQNEAVRPPRNTSHGHQAMPKEGQEQKALKPLGLIEAYYGMIENHGLDLDFKDLEFVARIIDYGRKANDCIHFYTTVFTYNGRCSVHSESEFFRSMKAKREKGEKIAGLYYKFQDAETYISDQTSHSDAPHQDEQPEMFKDVDHIPF